MRQVRIDAATGQSPGPVLQADLLPLAGHLGTSLGAVDAAGQVQEAVATDAFGQLRIPGSHSNPGGFTSAPAGGWQQSHLFAGEYWDQDSQLLYLRARWYDPQIGRFIGADPFEGRQREPRSLNRYAYANSDPVHNTDPNGLMTLSEMGTVAQNVVANFASRAQVAFTAGKQAGGAAVRTLGRVAERRVQEMIRKCFRGNLQRNVPVDNRRIDFLLDLKRGSELLEVKYRVPRAASEAFERLIAQIRAAQNNNHPIVVFFSQRMTDAEKRRVLNGLGPNKSGVELISGFAELAVFLGEAFLDCH